MHIGFWATAGAGAASVPAYELISTTVLGSAQAQVDFTVSSYSATYKHLQLRIVGVPVADRNVLMRLNSDTGANYSYHGLEGNGSTAGSFGNASQTSMFVGYTPAGSTNPSAAVIDLLDPYSTSKNKTMRSLFGSQQSSGNRIQLMSSAWYNTSSVTTISLLQNAGNWAIGSRFSLYGIRG